MQPTTAATNRFRTQGCEASDRRVELMLVMKSRVDPTIRLDLQPLQDRLQVAGIAPRLSARNSRPVQSKSCKYSSSVIETGGRRSTAAPQKAETGDRRQTVYREDRRQTVYREGRRQTVYREGRR